MTNREDKPAITILCEDIDHERFITEYLICCGFDKRQIRDFGNPKGRKIDNNNDFVIKHYPALVESYRRRKYNNIAIVVMIDADEKNVNDRIRALNSALDERASELNKDPRLDDEKIAIFVPARNIETWFHYINGNDDCNEDDDYKNKKLSEKERIELAKASARKLAREICSKGLDDLAPSSLHHACKELQRLQID